MCTSLIILMNVSARADKKSQEELRAAKRKDKGSWESVLASAAQVMTTFQRASLWKSLETHR